MRDPASLLAGTLDLPEAAHRGWDILVVGAGPSGALAAREAARGGASVLLVDKACFPRPKVCGCCLNPAALAALESVGLKDLPGQLGARPLKEFRLAAGGRVARIPLPAGAALSREALDGALVEEAIRTGVSFLPEATASLDELEENCRRLLLSHGGKQLSVKARVVLAADGLGGRLLEAQPYLRNQTAPFSRIGVGAVADTAPDFYQPGVISMACGKGGYVGLVRLEDMRLDIAAALDPPFVREASGPHEAVRRILRQAGLPEIKGLEELRWRGTPPLTRSRSRLVAERLLVIGDAATFIEPFTGEGIAWAFASAKAAAPLALELARAWNPPLADQWTQIHRQMIGRRQHACRLISRLLKHPTLANVAVRILSQAPSLSAPVIRAISAPFVCGKEAISPRRSSRVVDCRMESS